MIAAPDSGVWLEAAPGEPLQYFSSQPAYPDGALKESPSEFLTLPAPHESVIVPAGKMELIRPDDVHIRQIEPDKSPLAKASLYQRSSEPYEIYRGDESQISFMPGGGDQFGWLSFYSANYLTRKRKAGPTANANFHLLSGPSSIDLPARLYDFELGYQTRSSLTELFSFDASAMIGAYSDFKGSAREGVRFPAHAVGMFHPSPRVDWVVGVDYLGRDDVKILPVAGFCWHDPARPQVRYQMIFPRPRIDWTLSSESRLYLAGLLGGGTWQIEFPDDHNDVMTYRDLQMLTGVERRRDDGSLSAWELGWVFARKLEFRDSPSQLNLDDAFVLRYVTRR